MPTDAHTEHVAHGHFHHHCHPRMLPFFADDILGQVPLSPLLQHLLQAEVVLADLEVMTQVTKTKTNSLENPVELIKQRYT